MKIVIVGPGAMGCLFAAFLSKTKEDLWLFAKNKTNAQKIQEQGIIVEGVSGNWNAKVKITIKPEDIKEADLVIIAVKSYDTKEAIINAKPFITEKTMILTLQNGIGNIEILQEVAGPDKVIGGSTNHGSTLIEAGHIRHAGRGDTIIGKIDGKIPVEMRSIREIFNSVGIETRISRDIKGILWSKLIINAGINPLCAVLRLPNGKLLEFEWARKLMQEVVSEATRVAKRKRIKLIYDDPLSKVEAVCEATAANICSMLQDVLKKKRTEIDFINGAVVRNAQGMGISTPANIMLLELVKTIEASYQVAVSSI